jgi:hypothetical protein
MSIEHKNITDPNIHEPKGVNTAAGNTVYVATGSGSGTWVKLPIQALSGLVGDGVAGQSLLSTGLGTFQYLWQTVYGQTSFANLAVPTVITYPSGYTKVTVATTGSGVPREMSESTSARLTYTGTPTRVGKASAQASISHSAAGVIDLQFALYKNGVAVPRSEFITSVVNAQKRQINISTQLGMVTNDYFELFVKNNSVGGDVNIHSLSLDFAGV